MAGLHFGVFGQQDTTIAMDEVTVQANRLIQSEQETGRNLTVIKRKDLLASGVRSLDEAFQLLGGIEAQTRGVYGTQADLSIRGGTFNQAMVLIDGQPINDPLTGHFSANIPVNLIDVQQIEILRGPSAAIYGPDAVGGVINIVTKNDKDRGNLILRGGYEFGDFGLRKYDLSGEIGISDWRIGANYTDIEADGPKHSGDTTNRYVDVATLGGFVRYEKENLSAGFRISKDVRDFDARYFYTRSPFDRSTETVDRWWFQGDIAYKINDENRLTLNASSMTTEDEFYFTPLSQPNEHTTVRNDFRLEWNRQWSEKLSTIIGGNLNINSIESNDRGDHQESRFGGFAIAEYQPISQLTITPALRFDHAKSYGSQLNPQLSASYKISDYVVRGMVGRSIRAADYTERFISFGRTDTLASGRNLGNPDLQAETSWSSELGLDYFGIKGITMSLTGFYRKSENLIDYVLTPTSEIDDPFLLDPNGSYFYAQNIAELEHLGIETRLSFKKDIQEKVLVNGSIAYTFTETHGQSDEVSKYLSNHAKHLLSWNVGVKYRMLELSANSVFKVRLGEADQGINSQLDDSYQVINGRLALNILGGGLRLYGQINNITDTSYSDILGAELPGLWWSAGVLFNWN